MVYGRYTSSIRGAEKTFFAQLLQGFLVLQFPIIFTNGGHHSINRVAPKTANTFGRFSLGI